ncbi:MAG: hypothetical protein PHY47_05840 [Lachnospiraceae bacterium]|nr:hypothetical protein [Lachnospiraceae bacterium]
MRRGRCKCIIFTIVILIVSIFLIKFTAKAEEAINTSDSSKISPLNGNSIQYNVNFYKNLVLISANQVPKGGAIAPPILENFSTSKGDYTFVGWATVNKEYEIIYLLTAEDFKNIQCDYELHAVFSVKSVEEENGGAVEKKKKDTSRSDDEEDEEDEEDESNVVIVTSTQIPILNQSLPVVINPVILPTKMKMKNKQWKEEKQAKENEEEKQNKQEKESVNIDKTQKATDEIDNSKIKMQSVSEDEGGVTIIKDESVPLMPDDDKSGWIWFWVTFAFCEFLIIVGYKYNETKNKNKRDKKDL